MDRNLEEVIEEYEKMTFEHVMIDLETWGLKQDSAIRAATLITFNASRIGEVCYIDARPSIDDQLEHGRRIYPDTQAWWRKQITPLSTIIDEHTCMRSHVDKTLSIAQEIKSFLELHKPKFIWSRHSLDREIIRHLFDQLGLGEPWSYNAEYDCATFDLLLPTPPSVMPHDPFCDCMAQINHFQSAYALAVDTEQLL